MRRSRPNACLRHSSKHDGDECRVGRVFEAHRYRHWQSRLRWASKTRPTLQETQTMKNFAYFRPTTPEQAVSLLENRWGNTELLAGGTDLLDLQKEYVAQ